MGCVDDRSRDGGESCSVDECAGSVGGLLGGGGGADSVSSITDEYFVDLRRAVRLFLRLIVCMKDINVKLQICLA